MPTLIIAPLLQTRHSSESCFFENTVSTKQGQEQRARVNYFTNPTIK